MNSRKEAQNESPNRLLIAATSAAMITLLPVAAHQLGLLEHLPDPPFWIFDSDRITDSKSAHPLGVPDSALGLGSYGVTLALWNARLFLYQLRSDKTGTRGAVYGAREEAYGGADRESAAAG
jgi:hypothetical protein